MADVRHSKEVLVSKFTEQHFKKFLKSIDKSLVHLISEYTEIFSSESISPAILGQRMDLDRNKYVLVSKAKKQFKNLNANKKTFVERPFKESAYEIDHDVKCWFYKDDNEDIKGPFSTTEMDNFIHRSQIKAYTLVAFKNNEEFFPIMKMITEVNKKKNPDVFKSKGTYISYKGRNLKEDSPIKFPLTEESKDNQLDNLVRALEQVSEEKKTPEEKPKTVVKTKLHYWFNEEDKQESNQKENVEEQEPVSNEELLEQNQPKSKESLPVKKKPEVNGSILNYLGNEEVPSKKEEIQNEKVEQIPEKQIVSEKKDEKEILSELINENMDKMKEKLLSSSEEEEEDEWLQISSSNTKQKQKKKENVVKPSVVGLPPKKYKEPKKEEEEEVVQPKKLQIAKEFNKNVPVQSKGKVPVQKKVVQKAESEEKSESEDDGWIEAGASKTSKSKAKQSKNSSDSKLPLEKSTSNREQDSSLSGVVKKDAEEDSEWIMPKGGAKPKKGKAKDGFPIL